MINNVDRLIRKMVLCGSLKWVALHHTFFYASECVLRSNLSRGKMWEGGMNHGHGGTTPLKEFLCCLNCWEEVSSCRLFLRAVRLSLICVGDDK